MKYIKKFEIAKMYDENDIFHYIDNVDNYKIKELIKNIPNINLNIKNKKLFEIHKKNYSKSIQNNYY